MHVTPSHQYPLGVTMSAPRRLQLLEWARRSGAWVLEDDYDSEYRYESLPVSALQGLDRDSRVVYIGTFSKVLFPALRVGYLVVPKDLVRRFAAVRETMDIFPATFNQAVLADFIEEGHFARHLRRMRQLYRERRTVLAKSLRDELGGVLRVLGDQAGVHLVATLPKGRRDRGISLEAAPTWPVGDAALVVLPGPRHAPGAGAGLRRNSVRPDRRGCASAAASLRRGARLVATQERREPRWTGSWRTNWSSTSDR